MRRLLALFVVPAVALFGLIVYAPPAFANTCTGGPCSEARTNFLINSGPGYCAYQGLSLAAFGGSVVARITSFVTHEPMGPCSVNGAESSLPAGWVAAGPMTVNCYTPQGVLLQGTRLSSANWVNTAGHSLADSGNQPIPGPCGNHAECSGGVPIVVIEMNQDVSTFTTLGGVKVFDPENLHSINPQCGA